MKSKLLTSIIYTYVDKKKETFEVPRFHFIKSKRQYDKLVDQLLDIDAVSFEDGLGESFPVLIEVENNTFGPIIRYAKISQLEALSKELEALSSKIKDLK